MFDSSKAEKHPAYGMIGISRVSGSTSLFGSEVDHNSFIKLEVKRAERHRDLAHDWYFGRGLVCEVWMSHAQFAEAITTLNVGDGIPCTIRQVEGGARCELPPEDNRAAVFEQELKDSAKETASDLRKVLAGLAALAEKDRIGKTELRELVKELSQAICGITSTLPWLEKQFREEMERTVQRAKTEVEAFVTGAIHRAGLEALAVHAPALRAAERPQLEASPDAEA